jgi:outer membrane protein
MRLWVVVSAILFCSVSPFYSAAATDSETDKLHSVRVHWSKSSETDFVTVVIGDYQRSPESNFLIGASWGAPLSDTLFGLPFRMTWNFGMQYFDERDYQADGLGVTGFVKAHYPLRIPFTSKRIELGLGEGLSYVSQIPMSEKRDFEKKGVESEKLLNYLEWTVDIPLSQFAFFEPMMQGRIKELSVGFIVWHRSSIFGLMGESKGGVNFMGFGVEGKY